MKVLKQIKYKGQFYRVGQKIKPDTDDIDSLIRKGLVSGEIKPNKGKRTSKPKKQPEKVEQQGDYSYNDITVTEIKLLLDEKGISYDNSMNKEELYKLLGND